MNISKNPSFMINTISAKELLEKINQNPELLIINVLDEQYFKDCHITGSINITYDHLVETLAGLDKEKEIILYCANKNCPKSHQACLLLADLGFVNIYEFSGGITQWLQLGFATTGPCKLSYLHNQ